MLLSNSKLFEIIRFDGSLKDNRAVDFFVFVARKVFEVNTARLKINKIVEISVLNGIGADYENRKES